IIHRDIKPDNILITRSGVSKLADLGLAKRTDEASHLTATRQGFGTSYYMPYEQALNAKHADGRSDIYALGATLYHLITGEVPSHADPDLALQDPWVRACLASSAQPTQPDLSQPAPADMPTPPDSDPPPEVPTWIVRFPGRDGRWRRVRVTGEQLALRIREGR